MTDEKTQCVAGDFLKKFGYDPNRAYVPNKEYLCLNKSFYELKKKTRELLIKQYDIIISNDKHRELIFHGIDCKLTPKQFYMVKYLLENIVFHNQNFSQRAIPEKRRKLQKISPLVGMQIIKSKRFKGKYVINEKDDRGLLKFFKSVKQKGYYSFKSKMFVKNRKFFSASKEEISNFKNKIKKKIQERMLELKIELPDFEKKFEMFMKVVPLNYDLTRENPYTNVKTRYAIKRTLSRVKFS